VFGSCAVWVVRPCEEILWGGGFFGIFFRGDHALLLEPLPQGRTRFRQRERFRGLPVLFMGSMFEAIEQGYHQMNDTLKRGSSPRSPPRSPASGRPRKFVTHQAARGAPV
jgi:hypothetical protein